MTIIVIKSAICLTVLYGFYFFFLRNTKSLVFNRYYLLLSVLFALSIPLVSINNIIHFPPGFNISRFFNSQENLDQVSGSQGVSVPFLTLKSALVIIYVFVSSVLFVRFASNIYRMSGRIRKSLKVDYPAAKLVLVSDQVLPYSFLRYIFVNR